jgi:glycosyltransferase involved in cell wall biosynthesis
MAEIHPAMRVSVVVCTYSMDLYEHFCEAVESLLDQTYDDVEVVIVVDGTDDVAERVATDWGGRDEVIVSVNDRNVGLLESRNRGTEAATGDVVAFIDDDAVADDRWVAELVSTYESHDVEAAGGCMTPIWLAGKPLYLPEEFYWIVGVTHRGFGQEGPVRNTFGSNISFEREVFLELGGFDPNIGGRKGDRNLQGGETELAARLHNEYDGTLYYNPDAKVGHKVFAYRTEFLWQLRRAFWQGYSKRAMETLVPESGDEESAFLRDLFVRFGPDRFRRAILDRSAEDAVKFAMLFVFTASVAFGYLYGVVRWRR